MENLSVDNLLGIKYLNSNDLNLIFKTAAWILSNLELQPTRSW